MINKDNIIIIKLVLIINGLFLLFLPVFFGLNSWAQGTGPRIDSVTPSLVSGGGSVPITIQGENFSQEVAVSVYGEGMVLSGYSNTSGNAQDVMIVNKYAYVADGNEGLKVINIENIRQLTEVGSCPTSGTAKGVWVNEGYAYVADGEKGLQVIDVISSQNPTWVVNVPLNGDAYEIIGRGDYCYIAYGQGLAIVDICNPSNPIIKAEVETPGSARGVSIAGDYAYVADMDEGLKIIRIVDPSSPELISSLDTSGQAKGISVVGEYAYVAFGGSFSGLQIIHINDPNNPSLKGSLDLSGDAEGIRVIGSRAYIAATDKGLQMVDIQDPQNPALIGSYDTEGYACSLWVDDDYVYLADGVEGLQVINTRRFPLLGGCDTQGNVCDVWVKGDYAYLAGGNRGLEIIDLKDPYQPAWVLDYPFWGDAKKIWVFENFAFVVDQQTGNGLQIINIENPNIPNLVGNGYYSEGITYGVFVDYPLVYLANGTSGVTILEVDLVVDGEDDNIYNLKEKGTVQLGTVMDVWVKDNYIYAADGTNGLVVIRKDNLTAISDCDTEGEARGICVAGNIAYVADGDKGLALINIENPENPTPIAQADTPGEAFDVAVDGGFAFVADGTGDLAVIDVSDPQKPLLIAHVEMPGTVKDIFLGNGKIYCAAGEAGLQILSQSFFWTLQVQQVNTEGTQVQALLPPGIPRGYYTLRVTNPDGLADWHTDIIGISGLVYIHQGLNLLVCPDNGQGIQTAEELLLYLTVDYSQSVQRYDPASQKFQTASWIDGQIVGDFPLSENECYLLYMKQGKLVDFSIDQIVVLSFSSLTDGLSPGLNLIPVPTGFFSGNSTAYHLLEAFLEIRDVFSLQRYDQQTGRWLSTYQFMGRYSGSAYPLHKGEGCLLYLP